NLKRTSLNDNALLITGLIIMHQMLLLLALNGLTVLHQNPLTCSRMCHRYLMLARHLSEVPLDPSVDARV
ncbi:hypothetical protein BX616_009381, partial [Lobosporangium transversale]